MSCNHWTLAGEVDVKLMFRLESVFIYDVRLLAMNNKGCSFIILVMRIRFISRYEQNLAEFLAVETKRSTQLTPKSINGNKCHCIHLSSLAYFSKIHNPYPPASFSVSHVAVS